MKPRFFTFPLFHSSFLTHSCRLTHLAACFITSPPKDGMQPHPAFFIHCFIVCLNPTQSQKQGVCLRVRGEQLEERAIRVGHVITTSHQSGCAVASGIIVPCLAWRVARLISPGETLSPTINTKPPPLPQPSLLLACPCPPQPSDCTAGDTENTC